MDNKKNGIPKLRFPGFTGAWEQRKLGEVVNFLDTLRKPLEGAKRVKGPYPYYGASGIVDYVDGYLFDEELILLSEDGANITERNYPVCFLASGKYWVNNHAHVLKIKEDNDNNFICNSLERKDYTKYNTGMAMPKLNKETCKGIPIMCPNYDEQKKIGNYFRKFDTLIALHQRKLEHLQEQKKGLLQKMFPKNGEIVPEVRFPGFTDAWEQRKLGEILKERKERSSIGELISVTINNGVVKADSLERKDNSSSDKSNYKVVCKGDIAYNSMRMWQGASGYSPYNGILSPAYTVLIPTEKVDSKFISYMFKKEKMLQQFQKYSQGLTSDTWNLKYPMLKDIPVLFPKIDEQVSIRKHLDNISSLIALHQRKLDHLELMKKGLLQQMFV